MHKLSIYSEQNDLIFGLGKNKSRAHFKIVYEGNN